MALFLKKLYVGYSWLFNEVADPRSEELGLFLMSSPLLPVMVIAVWMSFVLKFGPEYMKNRQPFDLKKVIIVYNFVQIVLNIYLTYEAFDEIFFHMNWSCGEIDYGYSPRALYIVTRYHLFFISKFMDLLDTVIFVLRKKSNQLSFLHIYHHFGMFLMLWLGVKFVAGGHGTWLGLVNGFVHVVMYTYYLLSALDDKWKKNYACKKFITQVQMVQFLFFILIFGQLFFRSDCNYPKLIPFFFVPQNLFMLALFSDFYRKTYWKKKKED